MVKATKQKFGRIDILVNNSGVAGPTADVEAISLDQWEETLRVNLTGPYICCQSIVPELKHQRSGRIINISSMTGKRPLAQRAPYCASKMGLIGLTRCLAAELGPYDITVNAISPGATEGPRITDVIEKMAHTQGKSFEQIKRSFVALAPLGRFVTAEDVAAVAVFLASDLAANITGQDVNVSAGMVMY